MDETCYDSPTHKVDCFKNEVGVEVEWNNKDPFYDRDLNNFRLLFELRTLSVGVVITHPVGPPPGDLRSSRKGQELWIVSYTLQVLVTLNGGILDVLLAPTNGNDREAGAALLAKHRHLLVLGDTASISAPVAADLLAEAGITLLTVPRTNQKPQLPPALAALHTRWRQSVESVNGQLAHLVGIEEHHAHSCDGLRARLSSQRTAHTLAVYLTRLLHSPDPLRIKALAFPL